MLNANGARGFERFLTSRAAQPAINRSGMEPASATMTKALPGGELAHPPTGGTDEGTGAAVALKFNSQVLCSGPQGARMSVKAISRVRWLHWLGTVPALLASASSLSNDFTWNEEVKQEDGSVVLVRRLESRSRIGRAAPGDATFGYRAPRVELTDPKTGKIVTWDPTDLPPTMPFALHVNDGTIYLFTIPYLAAYCAYGAPRPPYIVFRRDADLWRRISVSDIPVRFHDVNLVANSGEQIYQDKKWQEITEGMTIKAGTNKNKNWQSDSPYDLYLKFIQYDNIGSYDDKRCAGSDDLTHKFDHVEIR